MKNIFAILLLVGFSQAVEAQNLQASLGCLSTQPMTIHHKPGNTSANTVWHHAPLQVQDTKKVSLAKSMLLSVVYPGWGNYQYKDREAFWLLGFASYHALAISIGASWGAKSFYNSYLSSNTIDLRNQNFLWASRFDKTSRIAMGVAIGIWSADLISVIVQGTMYSSGDKSALNKLDFQFYSDAHSPAGLSLKYSF